MLARVEVTTMPRVSTTAIIIGFSLGLLLGAPSAPAFAGPPAEQLASQIDRVLAVLDDPAFKGDEHVGPRRQAVRRVTDELIDWDEMGRRPLAARWQPLDDGERHAFVALFSELLDRAYLRNLDRYEGEKIVVTGDSVDGDRAVVRAKVVKNEGEGMALDFAMVRDGEPCPATVVGETAMRLLVGKRRDFPTLLREAPELP